MDFEGTILVGWGGGAPASARLTGWGRASAVHVSFAGFEPLSPFTKESKTFV